MNLSQLLTDPKSTKSKIASAKGSKQIHIIFSDIDFMTIEGIFAEMHGEGSILDMQKWAGKAKISFLKIKYCKRSKGILDTLYKIKHIQKHDSWLSNCWEQSAVILLCKRDYY